MLVSVSIFLSSFFIAVAAIDVDADADADILSLPVISSGALIAVINILVGVDAFVFEGRTVRVRVHVPPKYQFCCCEAEKEKEWTFTCGPSMKISALNLSRKFK